METSFDKKAAFNQIDAATRRIVDARYNLCLSQCSEKLSTQMQSCKQGCFKRIQVPYKILKHQAQEDEENLYKQCLADKFPNVKQEDYLTCTKNVYSQRVELMMTHFADTSEAILSTIH
jgi:hypothetical protein